MKKPFKYNFEWDPSKAQQDIRKHGVAFERAATIFLDPEALSQYNGEHSKEEDRWITLGIDRTGTLSVVCHTFEEETEESALIRIFSARKATKSEIKQYEKE